MVWWAKIQFNYMLFRLVNQPASGQSDIIVFFLFQGQKIFGREAIATLQQVNEKACLLSPVSAVVVSAVFSIMRAIEQSSFHPYRIF
jgi:hypothetical protein